MDEERQSSSNIDRAAKHRSPTNEEIKIYEQHRLENSFWKHFSKVESQLEEALARREPNEFWRMWSMGTEDGIVDVCVMFVSTARQRGNISLDTKKRGIHSEDIQPHKFSKTTTDTPLFHQSH